MTCTPFHHGPEFLRDATACEVLALLAGARAHADAAGHARSLRGRYAAVLGASEGSLSAELFAAAAAGLGANVARLPLAALRFERRRASEAARMLGRLYCALGCDAIGAPLAQRLARWSGLPVFDGVAHATHPARLLADLATMTEDAGRPPRGLVLQVEDAPASALALAWIRLGELTGLVIAVGAWTGAGGADFVCRRAAAPCASAPATLLAADRAGGPLRSLQARQAEQHGGMLQSLLAQAAG